MNLPMMYIASLEDIKKEPTLNLVTKKDWQKVGKFLEGKWPIPWPDYVVLDKYNYEEWIKKTFSSTHVVFDVETKQLAPKVWSGEIIQIGLYPIGGTPVIWDREAFPDLPFTDFFKALIAEKTMVGQNVQFDMRRIKENFGIGIWEYKDVDDTILMHHILWSEFKHSLSHMLSIYSEYPRAKHLGVGNYDYLVGDIVGEAEVYLNLLAEFRQDHQSEKLYYETLKPLFPIIIEKMEKGTRVDQDFVVECLNEFPSILDYAKNLASAYAGYSVSMDSGDQFRKLLTEMENVFDSARNLLGESVRKELTPKGAISLGKDVLDELRSAWEPVDFREDLTPEVVEKRLENGAHPLLEAKALWNKTRVLMSNYIKPLLVELKDGEEPYLHVGAGAPYDRRSVFYEEFREDDSFED